MLLYNLTSGNREFFINFFTDNIRIANRKWLIIHILSTFRVMVESTNSWIQIILHKM